MTAIPAFDEHSVQFETEIDVDARSVRLIGELDADTAPRLLAAAKTFLAEHPGDLILDLAGVTFADSALLNAIVEIETAMEGSSAEIRLINHSAAIKRLFLAGGATDLCR